MEYIYYFAHIVLETWEKEPIKAILGFEIWFLVCLLVVWGITSWSCLLYTSPSPRDLSTSRMPSSA